MEAVLVRDRVGPWRLSREHPDWTKPQFTDLQADRQLKPASINRYLISLKRYFAWAMQNELDLRDPTQPVKLVAQVPTPPRHLSDKEEADLVAAAEREGKPRDVAIIVLMLHTGLRIGEVCGLKWEDVTLKDRSGSLKVWGKRKKYRLVPLNTTARSALQHYIDAIGSHTEDDYVSVSQRTRSGKATLLCFLILK